MPTHPAGSVRIIHPAYVVLLQPTHARVIVQIINKSFDVHIDLSGRLPVKLTSGHLQGGGSTLVNFAIMIMITITITITIAIIIIIIVNNSLNLSLAFSCLMWASF